MQVTRPLNSRASSAEAIRVELVVQLDGRHVRIGARRLEGFEQEHRGHAKVGPELDHPAALQHLHRGIENPSLAAKRRRP
jgi:hypothetical protein